MLEARMMPDVHIKKWGFELWIVNTDQYCGKKLVVEQYAMCSIHMHKIKKETFFVQHGTVLLEIFDEDKNRLECFVLEPHMSITLEPYTYHRFVGLNKENHIFEFSTQHFEDDSYRIEESRAADE